MEVPCVDCKCVNYEQHTWKKNWCINCSHYHQPKQSTIPTNPGPLIVKLGGGTDCTPSPRSNSVSSYSSDRGGTLRKTTVPVDPQEPENNNNANNNPASTSSPRHQPAISKPPPPQLTENIPPPVNQPNNQPTSTTTPNPSEGPDLRASMSGISNGGVGGNNVDFEEEEECTMKITNTRDRVVKEILTTEQYYVRSLQILIKWFLNPLRSETPPVVIPPTMLSKIFSNIENLAEVNKHLLMSLVAKTQDWDPDNTKIGEIFLEIAQPLRFSKTFAASHVQGLAALEACEKNPLFHNFCQEWKNSKYSKGLDIRSYLIMPIQRVPRYTLLLSELLKNTPKTHPDFGDLSKARGEMEKIATEINEHVRLEENRQKILEIQESFGSSEVQLVSPSRRYIRDGPLMKICRKARKQRWFFLFNDLLLYGSLPPLVSVTAPDRFKFHGSINLSETFRIDDIPDNPTKNLFNAFQIVSGTKSFVVLADNFQSKIDWLLTISEVMKELKAKTKSLKVEDTRAKFEKPVWITDDDAPYCMACQAEFTVFRRRHHCRACGQVFCAPCSSRKVTLPGDKESSRICENCFAKNPQLIQLNSTPNLLNPSESPTYDGANLHSSTT